MVRIIDPKVEIIDYAPKHVQDPAEVLTIDRMDYIFEKLINTNSISPETVREEVLKCLKEETRIITPDQFVFAAAKATYKDVPAMQEIIENLKKPDFSADEIEKKFAGFAPRGHASLTTTPDIYFTIKDSSKLVDSLFTGARFGSFLMPSSRRVPITKENIVIPKGIQDKGNEAIRIYLEASEKNIETYEELIERGLSTQESSKIVQYGHLGGGFLKMPLETFIYFKTLADNDFENALPLEGKEIISQIDEWIRDGSGMETAYLGKLSAPRSGCVNPNIFSFERNRAQELIENEKLGVESILLDEYADKSEKRDERIREWLKLRKKIFSDSERIKNEGISLLNKLDKIVQCYDSSIDFEIATRIPWRIWGEVKRHRTLDQITEPVYNALDRARTPVQETENFNIENADPEILINAYLPFISIPLPVQRDKYNLGLWLDAWDNSVNTYYELVRMGVDKSDAITDIPRALKLANIKKYGLYNATTGYASVRKCATVEPEMKGITNAEIEFIKNSKLIPDEIKQIIGPKCEYVGYCPEPESCGHIKDAFVPFYNEELHKEIHKGKVNAIREELEK